MRASSLAFLALVNAGLARPFLTVPLTALPGAATAALAELAAATALSKFTLLGLLGMVPLRVAPPGKMFFSRSTRLRKGLGRFSSSEKSYSGAGGEGCGAVADRLGALDDADRLVLGAVVAFDDEGAGDKSPAGSDTVAESPGRVSDRRMDGRRNRDGWEAAHDD